MLCVLKKVVRAHDDEHTDITHICFSRACVSGGCVYDRILPRAHSHSRTRSTQPTTMRTVRNHTPRQYAGFMYSAVCHRDERRSSSSSSILPSRRLAYPSTHTGRLSRYGTTAQTALTPPERLFLFFIYACRCDWCVVVYTSYAHAHVNRMLLSHACARALGAPVARRCTGYARAGLRVSDRRYVPLPTANADHARAPGKRRSVRSGKWNGVTYYLRWLQHDAAAAAALARLYIHIYTGNLKTDGANENE